jgi:hypothetical protein
MRIPALVAAALLLPLPLAQAAQAAEPAPQAAQTVQSSPAAPINPTELPGLPALTLADEPSEAGKAGEAGGSGEAGQASQAGQSVLPGRLYVLPATVGTAPRKVVGPALRSGAGTHRSGHRHLRGHRQPARTTAAP